MGEKIGISRRLRFKALAVFDEQYARQSVTLQLRLISGSRSRTRPTGSSPVKTRMLSLVRCMAGLAVTQRLGKEERISETAVPWRHFDKCVIYPSKSDVDGSSPGMETACVI